MKAFSGDAEKVLQHIRCGNSVLRCVIKGYYLINKPVHLPPLEEFVPLVDNLGLEALIYQDPQGLPITFIWAISKTLCTSRSSWRIATLTS